jgi:hypothetical protein
MQGDTRQLILKFHPCNSMSMRGESVEGRV